MYENDYTVRISGGEGQYMFSATGVGGQNTFSASEEGKRLSVWGVFLQFRKRPNGIVVLAWARLFDDPRLNLTRDWVFGLSFWLYQIGFPWVLFGNNLERADVFRQRRKTDFFFKTSLPVLSLTRLTAKAWITLETQRVKKTGRAPASTLFSLILRLRLRLLMKPIPIVELHTF